MMVKNEKKTWMERLFEDWDEEIAFLGLFCLYGGIMSATLLDSDKVGVWTLTAYIPQVIVLIFIISSYL